VKKTFGSIIEAGDWENRVLRKLKVLDPRRDEARKKGFLRKLREELNF
jgi:hypothetical protein